MGKRWGKRSCWKSSGVSRRRGENGWCGRAEVLSHCNGNSVSPGALAAFHGPWGADRQLWEGGQLMAAAWPQAQLPSSTAVGPCGLASRHPMPLLPTAGEAEMSPSLPPLSFVRSEPPGIGIALSLRRGSAESQNVCAKDSLEIL